MQSDQSARYARTLVADAGHYVFHGIPVNKINPKKLLNSKWTAVKPVKKEKHFMVTEIEFDEAGMVVFCSIEAVISKRTVPINWNALKDDSNWIHGWK